MIRLVICALNPITRAGLESLVASPDIQTVESVAQLSDVGYLLTQPHSKQAIDALLVAAELNDAWLRSLTAVIEMTDQLATVLLVDEVDRRGLLQALSLGAVGILPAAISAEVLRGAIATVANGLTVMPPDFAETLCSRPLALLDDGADLIEPLTPREIEVLGQLAQGLSNKAIAKQLNISEHTVKFHISALFSKLNATSRTEAVALGLRQGLIML